VVRDILHSPEQENQLKKAWFPILWAPNSRLFGIIPLKNQLPFPETADIETSSAEYANRFSGEIGEWFLKVQEAATLDMLASYQGAKILDVGGGHGQLTGALIRNHYLVTILGSSMECKARVQDYLNQEKCFFKIGNILDLPFEDQEFEVVISYRLLAHVNRWQEFINELTRVAAKTVIIDYPEARSFNAFTPYLYNYKKNIEGNTRQYTIFRQADLLPVFNANDFILETEFAEFFLPMVFHRKLNSLRISSSIEVIFRVLGLTRLFGSPKILKFVRGGINLR
jgi:2-polyprenyl-3-methyl-5-hydroxy-6-metoxy-1,4-benzoquinol methylase